MNRKVLIIDDDTFFISLVTIILKQKNDIVYTAGNIEDGIKLLDLHRPEMVLLDNQLPDGNGWGKAEYILANFPNIQLTLMSAMDVPKTSTTSFRIMEKQLLIEELSEY